MRDDTLSVLDQVILPLRKDESLSERAEAQVREEWRRNGLSLLVPKLLELGVASGRVAAAVADARRLPVYPASKHGSDGSGEEPPIAIDRGDDSEWIYCDNRILYVVNPFDVKLLKRLQGDIKEIAALGVIARARLKESAAQSLEPLVVEDEQYVVALEKVLTVIRNAARAKVADIHLTPWDDRCDVAYNIDGELGTPVARLTHDEFKLWINSVQGKIQKTPGNYVEPEKGMFTVTVDGGHVIKLRVQIWPTVIGKDDKKWPKMVLRLLNNEVETKTLRQVGVPDWSTNNQLLKMRMLIERPEGLMVLTGPTGSGKTSNLAAVQGDLVRANPNLVIYTIEDPVEFSQSGVVTAEAEPKARFSFAEAVEAFLRGGPHVIIIGEVREEEVAAQALRAAITGHLVFTTLHTNSAPGAITRLLDLKCDPYIVSAALIAATGQRLVRKLCMDCSIKVRWGELISGEHKSLQGLDAETLRTRYVNAEALYGGLDFYPRSGDHDVRIPRKGGCPKCQQRGYRGRVLVHELLMISKRIERLIANGAAESEIVRQANLEGFKHMGEHAMKHVYDGTTSLEAASKVLDQFSDMDDLMLGDEVRAPAARRPELVVSMHPEQNRVVLDVLGDPKGVEQLVEDIRAGRDRTAELAELLKVRERLDDLLSTHDVAKSLPTLSRRAV